MLSIPGAGPTFGNTNATLVNVSADKKYPFYIDPSTIAGFLDTATGANVLFKNSSQPEYVSNTTIDQIKERLTKRSDTFNVLV